MTSRSVPFFPHRRNPDGTFNSICLTCLETVATNKTEEELKELDKRHICNAPTPSKPGDQASIDIE